jgi:NADPH-dependent glutamate synthase beta subunit-like oxidoreductase
MKKVTFSPAIIDGASEIVEKCMGHEDAFCTSRCPMSTDAKGYVNLIADKKYVDAIDLIREKLFLPNTLGRICAHPCEAECRRNTEYGQAIAIAALKRFAAEKADDENRWDLTVGEKTGKTVAIVGAGPAGAQAAIELRRQGHEVTIYEKLDVVGGMMRVGIPEYRLPRDIIDFEYSYLTKLGVTVKFGIEIGKDITFEELRKNNDAVILAHGAHIGNIIPLPGHKAQGVFPATEYLKEISMTRSFDRAGKKVMVIGGGDVAMDCARSSFRIGVQEVYQCSLENDDNLPASIEEIEESHEEGVKFNAGWGPQEIIEENGKVVGIKIQKVKSILDKDGNFNPSYEGEAKIIKVDTVIFATGQLVEDISAGALETTRGGRYSVDKETLATSMENVFVAGDASGSNIVIEAMALGRKAAISIERYFNNQDLKEDRCFKTEWSYDTELDVPLPEDTIDIPRIHSRLRKPEERKKDFEQVDLGFTEEMAIEESTRCLSCECKLCMKECVMMNDFGACPKDMMEKIIDGEGMDQLLAYSCNACDNCTIVCPHELPMKKVFIGARKDFVKANNGESPIKGHGAIKMHQLLGFSKLFTTKKKGGSK